MKDKWILYYKLYWSDGGVAFEKMGPGSLLSEIELLLHWFNQIENEYEEI